MGSAIVGEVVLRLSNKRKCLFWYIYNTRFMRQWGICMWLSQMGHRNALREPFSSPDMRNRRGLKAFWGEVEGFNPPCDFTDHCGTLGKQERKEKMQKQEQSKRGPGHRKGFRLMLVVKWKWKSQDLLIMAMCSLTEQSSNSLEDLSLKSSRKHSDMLQWFNSPPRGSKHVLQTEAEWVQGSKAGRKPTETDRSV